MVCVRAACRSYDLCTVSMSYLRSVYFQHVIVLVCVLAACHIYDFLLAACQKCGVCTVRCVEKALNTPHSTHTS